MSCTVVCYSTTFGNLKKAAFFALLLQSLFRAYPYASNGSVGRVRGAPFSVADTCVNPSLPKRVQLYPQLPHISKVQTIGGRAIRIPVRTNAEIAASTFTESWTRHQLNMNHAFVSA